MNIYVRRNIEKQWWEMCLETDRSNWQPIFNHRTGDFIEKIDVEMVRVDAQHLWGGNLSDYSVLMAPPLRSIEDTHR